MQPNYMTENVVELSVEHRDCQETNVAWPTFEKDKQH